MKIALETAALALLLAAPAGARTLTVSSAGRGDFKAVRAALDAAQPGDRVVSADVGKIGAKLQKLNGELVVIECLPGSAALKAGLTEGDRVDAANGVSLASMTVPQAVAALEGRPGSRVTLTIHSKEDPTPRPVVVTRLPASFPVGDDQSKAEIAAALGDLDYAASLSPRSARNDGPAEPTAAPVELSAGPARAEPARRAKLAHVSTEQAAEELLP